MADYNSESCDSKTIRRRAFALLVENNLLSPKRICAELHLSYVRYGHYINNLKSYWTNNYQSELGSRPSSVHGWSGWCIVPSGVGRVLALSVGWEKTKSKNRWLKWVDKGGLGRMMWFETGRVNLHVKSPVTLGKTKQLICNGFSRTGLIYEDTVMQKVLETIKPNSSHYVFDIGTSLPKKTITYFEKSHGLIIKVGDKSHPKSLEVESHVPDWAERLTFTLEKIAEVFGNLESGNSEKDSVKKRDYLV
jgi:hypothetical protein